jgi:hypothetical protein
MAETKKPLFSILHTSARPDQWRKVYDDWMSKAVHPEDVEYVLVIDPRWGFSMDPQVYAANIDGKATNAPGLFRVAVNDKRRCYVHGVNIAAKASSGSILIVNADDQFPCPQWDERLIGHMESLVGNDYGKDPARWPDGVFSRDRSLWPSSFVIEVSTGTPDEHDRGVMVMPILSRKRYEDQGSEVFYHEYESMFADNDFCEHARQDGVVIDARHLMFPHKHPMFDEQGWKAGDWEKILDAQYKAQNSGPAVEIGRRVIERRRAAKFQPLGLKRSIAFCYPGDEFRGRMVDSIMEVFAHLTELGFDILRVRSHTTNVYQTREEIRREILRQSPRQELVLWLDHDNPLSAAQFDTLLADLDAHPEVDGIAGWAWIYDGMKKSFAPSVGLWAPDHMKWQPFPSSFARETELKPFECGGLPCFLMRTSAFDKAGNSPFLPITDSRLDLGVLGEDFAFFLRAEKGGAKFLVDPRVRVPHLKYVDVEPVLPEEGAPLPVKVACMLRVRNEGRWLKQVIDAVRPLCGDDIYVMEDGSNDDTTTVVHRAGVQLLPSPFAGEGLNEQRDKNWLLAEVKGRCNPDWILMPDGDEELEPGGCDKIRRVLESNPAVDAFTLRILNLWNSVDTIRIDGVYGNMNRQSLFRANSNLEFQPCYPGGNENHVVLHVSNAPGLGGPRLAPLNVCLLHYGYLHKEDRMRKFLWIRKLDPNNYQEGFYQHMVQGDHPEVSATVKLKHAGPLELRKLPAHLIPKWEVAVPGPLQQAKAKAMSVDGAESMDGPFPYPPVNTLDSVKGGDSYAGSIPGNTIAPPVALRSGGAHHQNGGGKLNLGCCDRKVPGYLGVDRVPGPAVDVVADLSKPWPWPENSIDEIMAHDIIEHLPDKILTMNETWRVLKPGGKAEIVVPTVDGPGAFQDPTHVSFWHRHSFWYFEAGSPYRERFANSYGVQARFRVLREMEELTGDGPKLRITLEKVA